MTARGRPPADRAADLARRWPMLVTALASWRTNGITNVTRPENPSDRPAAHLQMRYRASVGREGGRTIAAALALVLRSEDPPDDVLTEARALGLVVDSAADREAAARLLIDRREPPRPRGVALEGYRQWLRRGFEADAREEGRPVRLREIAEVMRLAPDRLTRRARRISGKKARRED